MRIVYLHACEIPSVFANGVHVMRMCDAFADAGHDITLYAATGNVSAEDVHAYYGTRNRFPVRIFGTPRVPVLGLWIRAWRIRRAVRRSGAVDLVYGRDLYALLAAAGLAPLVYETHLLRPRRGQRALERVLFRLPGLIRVVTVTQALARDYLRTVPRLRRPGGPEVVSVPDCADLPAATGTTATLPGRPDALKVGYVGHLYPGRGIDVVFDLAASLPEADFHLVGGTDEDLAHWRGRPRTPNVYFHGHLPPAELHPYYRAFDLVLAPYQRRVAVAGGMGDISRWISPMKLFEYMAHGKAIIASDLPVLREVLTDGVNCLLCRPEDVAAWTAAVRRLADAPEERAALGETAERVLSGEYTWRARVDRVLPRSDGASARGGA
ncbi:glycosyltransferase family 4 protein [Streptomyces luteolus]|uniref:D-inositol 3-phosphate glycosyltransferase n=1 Tax=Streptomyces luteolus TaxID=3043615 RepID=A0ABT6T8N3_9ACTN|nr:glycosyltransferase family 4 protein [Streptomyces sp. B-S-A12]MDI3423354.1 glycosyltransferase family 4 protein [Streptomyces sp. B-S-A12]